MTLTSAFFLIGLLPWFMVLSFLVRKNRTAAQVLMMVENVLFIAANGVFGLIFVLIYSLMIYAGCLVISSCRKRAAFFAVIMLAICPLCCWKIFGSEINIFQKWFNHHLIEFAGMAPIGLSFFTFEAISCLSDVWHERIKKPRLTEIFLYLTCFQTITAGPIARIDTFRQGLARTATKKDVFCGIERATIGLIKKVLIADKLAPIVSACFDRVANGVQLPCVSLWLGAIAYALQLYFDFSGYSDMAIGFAKMLGIELPENFRHPYAANSLQDFWRRWHITLGTWFKDYVYIPLGGNRVKENRWLVNMLAVWLLTGIWHGLSWTFVVWGLGNFVVLIFEKKFLLDRIRNKSFLSHTYLIFTVLLLWIPFRSVNLPTAGMYLSGMFGVGASCFAALDEVTRAFPLILLAVIVCASGYKIDAILQKKRMYQFVRTAVIVIGFIFALCAVVNASYTPYIYGKF